MKKQYLLILVSMFLFFACTEQNDMELTKNDLNKKDNQSAITADKYIKSVLEAAEKVMPFKKEDGYTIGVLDENKQENECQVVYFNEKEYQKFRFVKKGNTWSKVELMLSKKLEPMVDEKSYVGPIAYVRGEYGNTLDVWYCWEYYSGYFSRFGYYNEPYLAWSLDFYPGYQVNNNRSWHVWGGNNGFYYGGTNWVSLGFYLDVTYLGNLPSAPSLQSPGNGATTGRNVNFIWGAVSGQDVDAYQIEVSNGFSATVSGTSKSFTGFAYSTSYTWKVRAHNPAGWGDWSATNSFTVQAPPPVSVTIVSLGGNQYRANVSGGSGIYTSYKWWYRNDTTYPPYDDFKASKDIPAGYWFYNSSWNTNTITFSPAYSRFSLKCEVTDSNGQKATDEYSQ